MKAQLFYKIENPIPLIQEYLNKPSLLYTTERSKIFAIIVIIHRLFSSFRFAPTRPPVHWSGIRSATSHGPVCPQAFPDISNASDAITRMPLKRLQYLRRIQPKLIHESEDCLHLNIYVPKGGKLF